MDTILKPYPYQEIGSDFLSKKKFALLGDSMGLGKTVQVIKAIEKLKLERVFILCPPIARVTWAREFKKWGSALNVRIIQRRSEKIKSTDQVVIGSFDYCTHNFKHVRTNLFDVLVVDESHFLKSIESKRTKAVLSKEGIIHGSKRCWMLTGTPMPNHPAELWPMLFTFGTTKLPFDSFVTKYCKWYDFNGRKVITGARSVALPELRETLNGVMLRRTAEEVLPELPSVRVAELPLEAKITELTPQLKEEFDRLELALENATPEQAMFALNMMAGSIATLRRYCAMRKVEALTELITEELESNAYEKIVIFGVHREALGSIQRALSSYGAVRIDGSISPSDRQRNIDSFQSTPGCRVFVGNIQAAGTNITLTAASNVVFLEQSWVPGDNSQAISRCARIGQKNSVFVRYCTLSDTIDQKIQEILASKSFDIQELLKTTQKEGKEAC